METNSVHSNSDRKDKEKPAVGKPSRIEQEPINESICDSLDHLRSNKI
jgi:hypothetical protein